MSTPISWEEALEKIAIRHDYGSWDYVLTVKTSHVKEHLYMEAAELFAESRAKEAAANAWQEATDSAYNLANGATSGFGAAYLIKEQQSPYRP